MENARTSSVQRFNDLPKNATIRKEYVKCGRDTTPISTFLIKYYGHKGDTQIVLIKGVNATDMMEETEVEAKFEEIRPKIIN